MEKRKIKKKKGRERERRYVEATNHDTQATAAHKMRIMSTEYEGHIPSTQTHKTRNKHQVNR